MREHKDNVTCELPQLSLSLLFPSRKHTQTHTHIAPLFVAGVTLRISWLNGNVNCRVIACNCIVNSRHSGLLSMLSIVATHATLAAECWDCCCCCDTCQLPEESLHLDSLHLAAILLLLLLLLLSVAVVSILFAQLPLLSCLLLSALLFPLFYPLIMLSSVCVCCAFIKRHSCMAPHATICELRLK